MDKKQISISMLEGYLFGVMFTFGVATAMFFLFLLNLLFFGTVIFPEIKNIIELVIK